LKFFFVDIALFGNVVAYSGEQKYPVLNLKINLISNFLDLAFFLEFSEHDKFGYTFVMPKLFLFLEKSTEMIVREDFVYFR